MSDNREPDTHEAETDIAGTASVAEEKWEDPVLPPDDFSDKEASDEAGDEDADEEPKRGKSGVLMFALLGAVALAGAGFAYLHFGNNGTSEVQKPPAVNTQQTAMANQAPLSPTPENSSVVADSLPVTTTVIASVPPSTAVAPAPVLANEAAPVVSAPALPVTPNIDVAVSAAPPATLPVVTPPTTAAPQAAVNASVTPTVVPESQHEGTAVLLSSSATEATSPATAAPALPVEAPVAAAVVQATTPSVLAVTETAPKELALPLTTEAKPSVEAAAVSKIETITAPVPAVPPVSTSEANTSLADKDKEAPPVQLDVDQRKAAAAEYDMHKAGRDVVTPRTKANKKVEVQHKKPVSVAKASKARAVSKPKIVPSYIIRSIMPGEAWVADKAHPDALQHVQVGDTLPGIGKVKTISEEADGWRVVGVSSTLRAAGAEDR